MSRLIAFQFPVEAILDFLYNGHQFVCGGFWKRHT